MGKEMKSLRTVDVFLDLKATPRNFLASLQEQCCAECKITILDVRSSETLHKMNALGIHTLPAIVMNGKHIAQCKKECPAGNALRGLT